MSTARLVELLSVPAPSIKTIEAHLDSLDWYDRIQQVRELGKRAQTRLWEATKGHHPIRLDFLVPASVGTMEEVVHHGKNSLLAFSSFAKVFCRPDDPSAGEVLWGYNRNGDFLETVVGPGYFVTRPYTEPGELVIDYTELPSRRLPDWPPIIPNARRIGIFVYSRMQDVLRGVSRHVSIGRAIRRGKITSNYFVLCRRDPS